jgi:metal-sulfur cluster biosynthetic enzyme
MPAEAGATASADAPRPDPALHATVMAALARVPDPEIGVNIVDLGLVVAVQADADGVALHLTLTSAACPMTELLLDELEAALDPVLPPGTPVRVHWVWDPPWTPQRMSAAARAELGWDDEDPPPGRP